MKARPARRAARFASTVLAGTRAATVDSQASAGKSSRAESAPSSTTLEVLALPASRAMAAAGTSSAPASSRSARARADLLDAGALLVPAAAIAREAGNAKTSNVVLLGALSARLDFPAEAWESTVAARVPAKTVEANLAALRAGRAFICEREGER